jgi:hypothetical protein
MLSILHVMLYLEYAKCQLPIGSYRLLGMLKYVDTWHIDTWHI